MPLAAPDSTRSPSLFNNDTPDTHSTTAQCLLKGFLLLAHIRQLLLCIVGLVT